MSKCLTKIMGQDFPDRDSLFEKKAFLFEFRAFPPLFNGENEPISESRVKHGGGGGGG
ncbi:MAG: hypothetical protein LBH18_02210 [Spirochaetaceae bacterium]|nr:hypothetical protein [Spirochaetaceae bacterium]